LRRIARIGLLTFLGSVVYAPAAVAGEDPHACFTQSLSFPVPGQTTTFDSSCSTGPPGHNHITSRAWDLDNDGSFDDGSGVTASRSFPSAGTYTVRLRVWHHGDNDTESKTITVNAPPRASFTNSPTAPQTGQLVTFTSSSTDSDGTIASQAWDTDNDGSFDDGTGTSATRTFNTPGDYTVRLRVTDNRGDPDTVSRTITVANRAPTASFTVSPASVATGESFTFTSTSTDPDGTIAGQAWDLDGDSTADFNDGTGTSATKSFAVAGTYPIRLRVIDNRGAIDIRTINVTVTNRGPVASFTVDPVSRSLPTGQSFSFRSTSTDPDGSIASQAWDLDGDAAADFGDGTGTTASKSFATPGTYPIRLRVTDNNGATHTATINVTATNRGPAASFSVDPVSRSQPTGESFSFTSTATDPDGSIVSQAWDLDGDATADFGDGTGTTASKSFATAGVYPIRLRVTDNSGATHTTSVNVTATNRGPAASFSVDPVSLSLPTGQSFSFASTSTDPDGSIASQAWDLDGDITTDFSNVDTETTATKAFATPGVFPIRLRVTDNHGASHSTTLMVTVTNRAPSAAFTFLPANPATGQSVTFTSTSTDADGSIAGQVWDLDDDGAFDDGTAAIVSQAFATPGDHVVRLRVRDNRGAETVETQTVTVGNRPPVAAFGVTPSAPVVGEAVTLTSRATDPDGSIAAEDWDLDGDGEFDDGTGSTASVTFNAAGPQEIGLRVTDDEGGTDSATETIEVAPAPELPRTETPASQVFDISVPVTPQPLPPPLPAAPSVIAPQLLSPFPTVRLRGRTTATGVRLTLFSVRGPANAQIELRCTGRGCPAKRVKTRIKTRRATGTMRIKRFERRLRAGLTLRVYVTKEGWIGKYTSVKIRRRLALPVRRDRCLMPGSTRPVGCPRTP
jgi:PKD repeat protein